MLKICIVNPFEHGGGAEYQISLLIDALSADGGFEIHYLTHFIDARDRTRNYNVSVVGAGGPMPRLGYVMDARSLYRKLLEIGPDVIYQRVACAYTGICALYSRRRHVPMIWHVASDSDVAPSLLEPVRNFVRRRLETWGVSYGAGNASRIVVQTRRQNELLQQNYGRSADALVANFHPPVVETIDKSGPLTVMWIANLKPLKRPDVFIRLAERFRQRREVRFVMAGAPAPATGDQRWRTSLMQGMVNAKNLEYVGQKTHAEVNQMLARSHVFVNTSTHEGFPNTFIQAWMRDVAVLSLSVDPDGVLERERVGIAAHTEDGLEAALRGLLDDPQLRAGYARRGREHAAAHHSLANAGRLLQVIRTHARGSED
jgi:glycosyltransferase involved in cell wall biosynthesis